MKKWRADLENTRFAMLKLDSDDEFMLPLGELSKHETDLVLSVFVMALIVDGEAMSADKRLVKEALSHCTPGRTGAVCNLALLKERFLSGRRIGVDHLQMVIDGEVERRSLSFRLYEAWQTFLDSLD